jgi:3-hydroxyisobutyrate dehydrogenase-like beta-hydroxyacid dehydrogenase
MHDKQDPVAVIGLGAMGWGLATRLLKTANLVAVFDASSVVCERARSAGLPVVDSIVELGKLAKIVVCMLPSPQIFLDLAAAADGIGGFARGTTVIDMATDGPDTVFAAAELLGHREIRVLDAAVGRGPAEAADGTLIIMAGGEPEEVDALRWLYELLGSEVYHCGPLGAGQSAKLVNNLVQCANAAILSEACALGRATGVSEEAIRQILPLTAAGSRQLDNIVIKRAPAGDYAPGFKVTLAAKDVRLAVQAGAARGESMPCSSEVLSLYERYVAAGFGDLDQAIIVAAADVAAASKVALSA